MESVEMMALITETPEDASGALSELKRLEQSGWIDLTYYVLFDLDPAGKIHLEETSDPEERADIPGEAGLAAGLIGHLLHADPSRGSASKHTRSKVGTNGKRGSGGAGAALATASPGLEPGNSALLLIFDERYRERVREEFQTRGRIFSNELAGGERSAALRASIARTKADVLWIETFLGSEVAKAGRASGDEKMELETTIAAARAELGAQRECLHARWKMLIAELQTELQQLLRTPTVSQDGQRATLDRRVHHVEVSLDGCNEQLTSSVLDHMDALAAHAAMLEELASKMEPEGAAAVEAQLHELEVRIRRNRGELTACIGASALRARQWIDRLLTQVAFGPPEMAPAIQAQLNRLNERHSLLKADLHKVEKEEGFLWPDSARAIRYSWRALHDTIGQLNG